jgi:hypothetical protein
MSATRHVETDALGGLREELMRVARRRASRRRPPRRALVIAALVGALLAATAAAAALTDFSTGVPVVDELVGIESGPGGHLRPGPGDASEALLVPMGDGVYRTVAYLARDGGVCIVYAERHRGGVRGGFGGCPPLDGLTRQVERRGGALQGASHGLDERTFQYIIDGDVESIRPLGKGDFRVLMTPPWTPEAPGARPLRLVVVIDDADLGGLETGDLPPEAHNQPSLELTYRDGHQRVLEGFQAK